MQSQENIDWHHDIFDVLESQDINLIAHVPDAGHAPLIRKCSARNTMDVVTLTTEEEGVGSVSYTHLTLPTICSV